MNLCNSQSQTYLKPEKQQIPQKDADAQLNESFGEQRKSSEKKQSDAVTHIKSRASSSGNTTTSMSSTLNSNRVRSKENVLKLVSSKRQAVGNAV